MINIAFRNLIVTIQVCIIFEASEPTVKSARLHQKLCLTDITHKCPQSLTHFLFEERY